MQLFQFIQKKSHFKHLKSLLAVMGFLCFTYSPVQAQHLEVEGNSKIRGNLDIGNMQDTTSVYMGPDVGLSISYDSLLNKRNIFIGSNAGLLIQKDT